MPRGLREVTAGPEGAGRLQQAGEDDQYQQEFLGITPTTQFHRET